MPSSAPVPVPVLRAEPSTRLRARIVRRTPLRYEEGASEELDRPAHVRAASGLARVAGGWAIAQDDAAFVAIRRDDGGVEAIALPRGEDGRRRFEDALGNKALKPDLESAVALPERHGTRLLAFGSGSTERRTRIAVVDVAARRAELRDATELYVRLRAAEAFAGSELNVEGAALVGPALRLFQRGNGAPRGGLQPVDATADLDLDAFVAWLDGAGPLPELTRVRRYELGRQGRVAFSFTDATVLPDGRILFSAGAEDSPDAVLDGEVLGARLGLIDGDEVTWTTLLEPDGAPSRAKVEGIAVAVEGLPRVFAVTDMDDPDEPAAWCELEVTGI